MAKGKILIESRSSSVHRPKYVMSSIQSILCIFNLGFEIEFLLITPKKFASSFVDCNVQDLLLPVITLLSPIVLISFTYILSPIYSTFLVYEKD